MSNIFRPQHIFVFLRNVYNFVFKRRNNWSTKFENWTKLKILISITWRSLPALNWVFLSFLSSRQQVSNWSMTKENHDPAGVSLGSPSSRLMQQKSVEKTHQNPQHDSPQTAKLKSSSDLFELLERCQSQRLDDQRCVLPSYFSQVSLSP